MFRKIAAVAAALLISLSAQAEVQPGKVVYRAGEATTTQRIKFHASLDNRSLGRLKYNTPVVAQVEPSIYELGTSLPGTEALTIDVKPGHTYYVYAGVKKMGKRVSPSLQVVEEQVAVAQKPAIEEII